MLALILSPIYKDTILGTIRPIKGILPAVTTTHTVTSATIIKPILTILL